MKRQREELDDKSTTTTTTTSTAKKPAKKIHKIEQKQNSNENNSSNPTEPINDMKEWWLYKSFKGASKGQVKVFFETWKDGEYKDLYTAFSDCDGEQLLNKTQEQIDKRLKETFGTILGGDNLLDVLKKFKDPEINTSSVDDLLRSLRLIGGQEFPLKKEGNFHEPHSLIGPPLWKKVILLEPFMKQILEQMNRLRTSRIKNISLAEMSADRTSHNLQAISAAPGTGKTQFLESFSRLTKEMIQRMGVEDKTDSVRKRFEKQEGHDYCFVNISFYNGTSIRSTEEKNGDEMLVSRFIYSAFFEQQDDRKFKGSFSKWLSTFHSAIRKASSPGVLFNEVLHCYIELVNRSVGITNRIVDVVLCVDGIMQLKYQENLVRTFGKLMIPTLSTLCKPMNYDPRYWLLVTSLNPAAFQSVNIDEKSHFSGTAGSQRTIDFWSLPIPLPLEVKGLFSKFYDEAKKSLVERKKQYPALSDTCEQRLNWLVTYCANHWITLEKLYTTLQVASSFQDVIEKLKTDSLLVASVGGINESLVRLVLIGDYVKTDELVEGTPISEYLEAGLLFNSDPTKRTDKLILPAMTLWQLYSWSADNDVKKSALKTSIFNKLNYK